jgi:hypothetical protein
VPPLLALPPPPPQALPHRRMQVESWGSGVVKNLQFDDKGSRCWRRCASSLVVHVAFTCAFSAIPFLSVVRTFVWLCRRRRRLNLLQSCAAPFGSAAATASSPAALFCFAAAGVTYDAGVALAAAETLRAALGKSGTTPHASGMSRRVRQSSRKYPLVGYFHPS